MNNLLSYCALVDARIRASDKDLPVWADAVSWLTASKVSSSFSREPLCALWRPVFDDVALRNPHVQFDEIFQFKFLSCSRHLNSEFGKVEKI